MLWWLTENALAAAVLAGMVAGLCRLVRLSPAVRHALWLLILIKMLTPPLLTWPWPSPDLQGYLRSEPARRNQVLTTRSDQIEPQDHASAPLGRPEPSRASEPEAAHALVEADHSVPPRVELTFPEETGPSPPAETEDAEKPMPVSPSAAGARRQLAWLAPVALALWLAGAACTAALQCVQILHFRRRLVKGRAAPLWLSRQLEDLAHTLGVRAPAVLVLPGTGSPLLWGLGRPRLLWPEALLGRLPVAARPGVLVHELAHLRRRDHWVGWLQMAASCVWWWNPVYWYVRRQLRENAELACDAWVLWALPQARRVYAEALIEVCQIVSRKAAPVAALGMGGGRRVFERRLTMIMREQVPCRLSLRAVLSVGLVALIVLPGWSPGQSPVEKNQDIKLPNGPRQAQEKSANVGLLGKDDVALQQRADDKGSAPDRDRRLEAVERQLQALLKEVQALRGNASANGRSVAKESTFELAPVKGFAVDSAFPKPGGKPGRYSEDSVQMLTLARASYKLPPEKARALADFLREQLPDDVMELKVNAETITITTTPETQKAIGQLVSLMRMSKGKPSGKDKYPTDYSGEKK